MDLTDTILSLSHAKTDYQQKSALVIYSSNKKIENKLRSKLLPFESVQLSSVIHKLHTNGKIEQQIRVHHLQEASRKRDQLSQKLNQLDKTIESLSSPYVPQKTPRIRNSITKDYTKQAKVFYRDQQQRNRRIQDQIQRRRQQIQQQTQTQEQRRLQIQEKKAQKRELKLLQMQEKSVERQRKMLELQQEVRKGVKYTPLYIKKEQQFNKLVDITEPIHKHSTQRKIDFKAIKIHEQKYIKHSQSQEAKRKKIFNMDLNPKQNQIPENTKQTSSEKMKEYAKLVKILYQPAIDSIKQKEMELIKEKMKIPVRKKKYTQRPHHSKTVRYLKKQNISLDISKPKIQIKDYLSDIRQKREFLDQKLLNTSNKIACNGYEDIISAEIFATRKEKSLKRMQKGREKLAAFKEEEINDIMISSVKAKVKLLK